MKNMFYLRVWINVGTARDLDILNTLGNIKKSEFVDNAIREAIKNSDVVQNGKIIINIKK